MEFTAFQRAARETSQFSPDSLIDPMVGLASKAGSVLTCYKRYRREGIDRLAIRGLLKREVGDLMWYAAAVATACDLDMEEIVSESLERGQDRYGAPLSPAAQRLPTLDARFPLTERFPRRLVVEFRESLMTHGRGIASMTLVEAMPNAFPHGTVSLQDGRFKGYQLDAPLGNHLTDNSRRGDAYRFHDAIHLAFMAVLGWSPTMRVLLGIKRKSDPETDEVEDGARAIFAEEGLIAALSRLAGTRMGFMSERTVDRESLDLVRALTSGTEAERLPSWLWTKAITQGFQAMHQLDNRRRGYLIADLDARCLLYESTYQQALIHQNILRRMSPLDHLEAFREAIRRLHAVKDAAYRDAWKKRGETIGVLANIARKLDRLEAALAGAPALPDESLMDTAVDLLVYSIKYQTYLADVYPPSASALFLNVTGPFSDGIVGFELLLNQLDLSPLDQGLGDLHEAARRVQTCFVRIEECIATPNPSDSISLRTELAAELSASAVSVIAALKRTSPGMFANFTKGFRYEG